MAIRKIIIFLLPVLIFASCLKEDLLKTHFKSIAPSDIGDGLIISDPWAEQVDSIALSKVFNDLYYEKDFWPLRSMLVFRNGKLIGENYYKDANDITNRHLIWSCTKQVVGVLAGIGLEQGVFDNINDPISKYFDEELSYHPDKKDITLRNLLTMQSGIDYENDGVEGETDQLLRQIPDNSVDFVLSQSVIADQGTEFYYKDGDPHLISALIQKAVGKPTDEWAEEALFAIIDIENYNWVRYKDGVTLGGFGIETTPREMAKIALLVANNGNWNGTQVVSASWITAMTSTQVDTGYDYDFGFLWWRDNSRNIHFMWGHGGQFAFVVPDYNMVVVMTSFPNTQGDYQISADEALPIVDLLIDACY